MHITVVLVEFVLTLKPLHSRNQMHGLDKDVFVFESKSRSGFDQSEHKDTVF